MFVVADVRVSAVLNLPSTASQNEIRERYRALSVIFHPDKQRDARTKDTATSQFLDIQKAYEGEIQSLSTAILTCCYTCVP